MRTMLIALAALAAALCQVGPSAAAPSCAAHLPYGAPIDLSETDGDTVTICHKAAERPVTFFVVHYDRDRIAPRWVAYHLSRTKMFRAAGADVNRTRHGHQFIPDSLLDFDIPFRAPHTATSRDRASTAAILRQPSQ